ncbi:MAG TPA: efflux RND transporter periplasmic adaptor subunit [Tepidisphaeraceae bacterium]|jgi:RND family efflux transporter MFP subunit|nr:efflux RND transporter periplasmic adaptor subunit [Tepidisphaeraceae bacterium]
MSRIKFRHAALAAAVVVSSLAVAGRGETKLSPSAADSSGVSVITYPSAQPKLKFMSAGLIKESLVKDGDHVKAGQVLLRQDTDVDDKELARLKVEAESDSRIDAAKADEKVKQIDYDRKSKAPDSYAASEIEESEAKLIESQKSVKVAEEDKQEAKMKFEEEQVRIQKMELKSPIDGTVQHVVLDVGEMADPQDKDGAVVVVKNDPLWVEIRGLTTMQVAMLKEGTPLQVRYLNDGSDQWKEGKIIFITPVADASADRQLVRLELPNPEGRDAGMRMELKLPKELQDAAPKDDAVLSFQVK